MFIRNVSVNVREQLLKRHREPRTGDVGPKDSAAPCTTDCSTCTMAEAKALLAAIVESSDDAIIAKTIDGIITTWNASAERMYGYLASEAIGQPITLLHPPEMPYEDQHVREEILRGGHIVNRETVRIRKDGTRIHVAITFSPVRNLQGDIIGVSSIHRDISKEKQAEQDLKEYARRLEESNQALQDFASVASHDLQEPLRKIQTFGSRLISKFGPLLGREGLDDVERMLGATQRMETLILSLLAYSRVTTRARPFSAVDLNDTARNVASDLDARIEQTGGNVEFGELPVVEADPTQMHQLFLNLISNALKFHKRGERPRVRVYSPSNGNGCPEIKVEDNGIGFDEKHLDRILQPFQRLHSQKEYEGAGIGLAIVKKIVERHGGSIVAKSKPGEGATFIVRFPSSRCSCRAPAALERDRA